MCSFRVLGKLLLLWSYNGTAEAIFHQHSWLSAVPVFMHAMHRANKLGIRVAVVRLIRQWTRGIRPGDAEGPN